MQRQSNEGDRKSITFGSFAVRIARNVEEVEARTARPEPVLFSFALLAAVDEIRVDEEGARSLDQEDGSKFLDSVAASDSRQGRLWWRLLFWVGVAGSIQGAFVVAREESATEPDGHLFLGPALFYGDYVSHAKSFLSPSIILAGGFGRSRKIVDRWRSMRKGTLRLIAYSYREYHLLQRLSRRFDPASERGVDNGSLRASNYNISLELSREGWIASSMLLEVSTRDTPRCKVRSKGLLDPV